MQLDRCAGQSPIAEQDLAMAHAFDGFVDAQIQSQDDAIGAQEAAGSALLHLRRSSRDWKSCQTCDALHLYVMHQLTDRPRQALPKAVARFYQRHVGANEN